MPEILLMRTPPRSPRNPTYEVISFLLTFRESTRSLRLSRRATSKRRRPLASFAATPYPLKSSLGWPPMLAAR